MVPAAASAAGLHASIIHAGTAPGFIAARGGFIVLRAQVRNAVRCSFQGQHFSSDGFHNGPTVACRSGLATGRMRVAANVFHHAVKIHFLVTARDAAGKTIRKTFAARQAAAPAPPPPAPPLAVQTTVLPSATLGVTYSTTLTATGGVAPYTWAVASGDVPPGIAVSSTGAITGTTTTAGQWTFSVQVTDAKASSSSATLLLTAGATPAPAAVAASTNWSGYVLMGSTYAGITGTFNVPRLNSSPRDAMASQWLGIDGANNSSLIQAGVAEQYSAATNSYLVYAWVEELPATATVIPLTVVSGDEVTVTIVQVTAAQWGILVKDDSTRRQYSTSMAYSGPATSAEWIVEAPMLAATGAIQTLANADPVTFTQLGVDPVVGSLTRVIMFQNGVAVSTPSDLSPNGFTVAYGDVAPAAP